MKRLVARYLLLYMAITLTAWAAMIAADGAVSATWASRSSTTS